MLNIASNYIFRLEYFYLFFRKLPVLSPAPKKKSNALSSAKSLPDLNSSIATFPSKAAQVCLSFGQYYVHGSNLV